MNKFRISLFVVSMVAATTFGQNSLSGRDNARYTIGTKESVTNTISSKATDGFLNLQAQSNAGLVATASDMPTTVITEQPEGVLHKNMYGISQGFLPYYDLPIEVETDGRAIDIVEAEDGSVYIKNPVSKYITNTWIKGTRTSDNSIVFKLPQLLTTIKDENTGELKNIYVQNIKLSASNTYLGVDQSNNQVEFVVNGDTLSQSGTSILGLTYENGNWTGYADDGIVIFKNNDVPSVPPTTVSVSKYAMVYKKSTYETGVSIVKGVKDGNDIYIGDLSKGNDFWVKGTVIGNKVMFNKQYLGVDEINGFHKYFIPADVDSVPDAEAGFRLNFTLKDKMSFDYDPTNGAFSTNSTFVINVGKNIAAVSDQYDNTSFKPWADKAFKPKNATITDYSPWGEKWKYGTLQFIVPGVSVDGDVLITDNLYYRLYFDNELYTFTTDKYEALKENTTDIPFNLNDDYDFVQSGMERIVAFYFDEFNYTKAGVQLVYKYGDETGFSDIVYNDGSTARIHDTGINDTAGIKSIEYLDLSGRTITNAASGIYIKLVKYSDGRVRTTKVVRK